MTIELKALIDRMLPEAELERIWKKKLYSKDPEIAMKAFELALHYRFGKPMTIVAGPEEHPPIKVDISAIRNSACRCRNDFAAARKREVAVSVIYVPSPRLRY